jgi:hypothetical protein
MQDRYISSHEDMAHLLGNGAARSPGWRPYTLPCALADCLQVPKGSCRNIMTSRAVRSSSEARADPDGPIRTDTLHMKGRATPQSPHSRLFCPARRARDRRLDGLAEFARGDRVQVAASRLFEHNRLEAERIRSPT